MKSYRDITFKYLKKQKKRTILTAIGIVLSVALITAIGTMFVSLRDLKIREAIRDSGDYYAKYTNVDKDKIQVIKNHNDVKNAAVTMYEGDAVFKSKDSTSKVDEYYKYNILSVYDYDKNAYSMLSVKIDEGKMPQNPGEIIIDKYFLDYIGSNIKIGDKIKLEIGDRKSADGKIMTFNNRSDDEVFYKRTDKEYTIVGFIKEDSIYSGNIFGKAIAYYDENAKFQSRKCDVYVKMNSVNNAVAKAQKIAENVNLSKIKGYDGNNKYPIEYNNRLLSMSGQGISQNMNRTLWLILLLIVAIIIISTMAVIYNAFNISVLERISQFGILRCTGASPAQIKAIVLLEALILCIVSIPIGLLCGVLAMKIVLMIINSMKYKLFGNLSITISSYVFIVSAAIGLVTVLLSALGPARKAGKVSALEAVRNSGSFKKENFKKVKNGHLAKMVFGIEGNIAYKNLRRNKKRFRITVFSMSISIVLYIFFGSLVDSVFKMSIINNKETGDFSIWRSSPGISQNVIKEVKGISGVDKVYQIMNSDAEVDIPLSKLNDKFVSSAGLIGVDAVYQGLCNSDITSFGDTNLNDIKKYLVSGSADKEALDKNDGVILVNVDMVRNNKKKKVEYIPVMKCNLGDSVKIKVRVEDGKSKPQYKTVTVKIMGIADKGMLGSCNENEGLDFITTENVYKKIIGSNKINNTIIFMKNGADKTKIRDYFTKLNEKDKTYQYTDYLENAREAREQTIEASIFLYGFVGVIALIGCLNIINTISTNIILRKRELSMLKAVGMTSGGIRKMVILESAFYGIIASIYGIIIGTGLSYLLFKLMNDIRGFEWSFPYKHIFIAVTVAILIALISGIIPLKRINKGSIIENIRMEE